MTATDWALKLRTGAIKGPPVQRKPEKRVPASTHRVGTIIKWLRIMELTKEGERLG